MITEFGEMLLFRCWVFQIADHYGPSATRLTSLAAAALLSRYPPLQCAQIRSSGNGLHNDALRLASAISDERASRFICDTASHHPMSPNCTDSEKIINHTRLSP
jgi:hypothetical protein